ncbi:MAG: Patatin [Bacteroidetes bacterium]|jgi:NTE family protein|nr:Patatin [Bacteroidota bacterium]
MKKFYLLILLSSFVVASFAQQLRLGVTLSGGGALGFAHIGALQALEEYGLHPQFVSGTSMGAVVGSFYAAGYTPQQILVMTQQEKMYKKSKLIKVMPHSAATGLSTHNALRTVLKKYIPSDDFDSLPKRFFCCATDLTNGKAAYFGHGKRMSEYVVASASIPGVFDAVTIDSINYVDGGALNNIPAQPIRPLCDVVIGVNVDTYDQGMRLTGPISVLNKTVKVVLANNAKQGANMCDFLISIPHNKKISSFSFGRYKDIYMNGYITVKKYIEEHPEILKYADRREQAPAEIPVSAQPQN